MRHTPAVLDPRPRPHRARHRGLRLRRQHHRIDRRAPAEETTERGSHRRPPARSQSRPIRAAQLAYTTGDLDAEAGTVEIVFDNPPRLGHNVRSRGPDGGKSAPPTPSPASTATADVELEPGRLHILLLGSRPPGRRHEGRADGQVAPRRFPARPRPPALITPADRASATQTGFSLPSTSTVKTVTICHQPSPTSSTEIDLGGRAHASRRGPGPESEPCSSRS